MQIQHIVLLKMPVAITSYEDAVSLITESLNDKLGKYVCVANVHMCMEVFDSNDFCQVVNNADLVVPDGRPLVWGLKLLGEKKAQQVRGSHLMMALCTKAELYNISIGLYGGAPEALDGLLKFLKCKFPNLKITFTSSPPFRPLTKEEDENYVKEINNSGARILFVGIGCPKQETWMAEHQERLSCVMIGIGAAFDFLSGQKKNAPICLQKLGLEWVFRLMNEPKRLWKRYLKHNSRFVWYFCKQLLGINFDAKR